MVMEVSGDHKLCFAEFTVGLMNYCTCSNDGIVRQLSTYLMTTTLEESIGWR